MAVGPWAKGAEGDGRPGEQRIRLKRENGGLRADCGVLRYHTAI